MSEESDPVGDLRPLFELTGALHKMAILATVDNVSGHLVRSSRGGFATFAAAQIHEESDGEKPEVNGIVLLLCGPNIPKPDIDSLREYVEGMLQDIDPKAASGMFKNNSTNDE